MKKTILALLLVGSSCVLFAQDDSTQTKTTDKSNMNNNMNNNVTADESLKSTGTYNAYGTFAPSYMQMYIQRDYPTASNVMWRQNGDWWQAYYMENDQPHHVYYNTSGKTFTVALPVRHSLIPETVVSKVNSMFGPSVYDITTIKGSTMQDVYLVRLLENGQLRTEYLNEDGSKTMDVYRVETTEMNSVNGNVNNMTDASTTTTTEATTTDPNVQSKTKIKHDDGTETKIKTKDGKTKVKKDD